MPHLEAANDNGKDVELSEEVKEAFDRKSAPEGPVEGDLGELDRDMEAREFAKAKKALDEVWEAEEPVDLDMTPAPKGAIKDKGLSFLDKLLGRKRKEEREDDDGELKKAA